MNCFAENHYINVRTQRWFPNKIISTENRKRTYSERLMSETLQSCDWQKHETRYGLLLASSPTLPAVAYYFRDCVAAHVRSRALLFTWEPKLWEERSRVTGER